ncbi:hypothetical protein GM418_15745 [Maribellus comscasis]|uniref:Uncharacterized protein n=1 Tax=Maribellus comscasis TaxID=2681766 RepID=A0A6I6JY25_9BACT|nr:hypothetical protein [Maribellus comscasis]QGY45072.1 hypothetical protein GM418_15745 [Maribellus comscasis]
MVHLTSAKLEKKAKKYFEKIKKKFGRNKKVITFAAPKGKNVPTDIELDRGRERDEVGEKY